MWLGRDETLGRTVALKRVGVAPGGDSPDHDRAEREARMAARLSHPHVVSVYDLAVEDDLTWLVMEYVEGTNLAELVTANGSLSVDQAVPILAQTADALAAAHAVGVVHRDVKPSNILVTPEGQVKLTDFGIARGVGDAALTQTGLVTGSPAYLAPEIASGRTATARSDIWSLGATAYHALEGHPPYDVGDNLLGALYRIVHETPPQPSDPGWLLPLFAATMTRDEGERWDAEEVRRFLMAGPDAVPAPRRLAVSRTRGRRSRSAPAPVPVAAPAPIDHATQVMPPARTATRETPAVPGLSAAGPTGPAAAYDAPGEGSGRRRRTAVLAAVLLLLAAAVASVVVVMTGPERVPEQAAPAPTPSASPTPSPSASAAIEVPTAEGMQTFVRDYLSTAAADPEAGFALLTPAFARQSQGLAGYSGFWGPVDRVDVASVEADPESLRVSYTYSYRREGVVTTEPVSLQLAFRDGRYLVADEL